jgi:hypothetical protein
VSNGNLEKNPFFVENVEMKGIEFFIPAAIKKLCKFLSLKLLSSNTISLGTSEISSFVLTSNIIMST